MGPSMVRVWSGYCTGTGMGTWAHGIHVQLLARLSSGSCGDWTVSRGSTVSNAHVGLLVRDPGTCRSTFVVPAFLLLMMYLSWKC